MNRGAEARKLVRRHRSGALATMSTKFPGYPFASALPFCTDQRGRIVVLISHLAEHTRNADANPHSSFLITSLDAGLQEQPRLTLLGDLAPIDEAPVAARYLRLFPEAGQYLRIGGFRFFRMEPLSLRYIAGFASIHTLTAESYLAPAHPISDAEADILAHMNADHAHSLRDYCRHLHGRSAQTVEMAGIDCDGFDLRADGALLRCDFANEITDASEARAELVRLAGISRA
jgi:hypothetical protein